jgi:hypothetical protein
MKQSWRAKLEPRADADGTFSLIACSSEGEVCIMSGLLLSEADSIVKDVNTCLEQ